MTLARLQKPKPQHAILYHENANSTAQTGGPALSCSCFAEPRKKEIEEQLISSRKKGTLHRRTNEHELLNQHVQSACGRKNCSQAGAWGCRIESASGIGLASALSVGGEAIVRRKDMQSVQHGMCYGLIAFKPSAPPTRACSPPSAQLNHRRISSSLRHSAASTRSLSASPLLRSKYP